MILEIINEQFLKNSDGNTFVWTIILKSYKTDILTKESKSTLFKFELDTGVFYILYIWSEYGWQKIEKIRVKNNTMPTEIVEESRHIIQEFVS